MKPKLNRIALVGWRGIEYEEIRFEDEVFAGLTGGSGAGKTTVALCLAYALLPDRKTMSVRPLSSVNDPTQAEVDQLAVRMAGSYAYVVLDIMSRDGSRVVAGIHAAAVEAGVSLTGWHIRNADGTTPLQDYLRSIEGDKEEFPDLHDLRAILARRSIDLHICRSVAEYGELLYDVGILPTSLAEFSDRTLYAKLIDSTFRGGLSADVTSRLKDYLLPEASRVPEALGRLQQCAAQLSRTKRAVSEAQRTLALLKVVYEKGKQLVCAAIWSVQRQQERAAAEQAQLQQLAASLAQTIEATEPALKELAATEALVKSQQQQLRTERQRRFTEAQTAANAAQTLVTQRSETVTKREEALKAFDTGRRVWETVTHGREHAPDTYEDLMVAIGADTAAQHDKAAKARLDLAELDRIIKSMSKDAPSSSAVLAERLGGMRIAESASSLSLEDARATEMALAGLTEGVVGVALDGLASLADEPALPDTFWLCAELPQPESLHQVGAWQVLPLSNGYVVTSQRRPGVLGEAARKQRRAQLEDDKREPQRLLAQAQGEVERLTRLSRTAAEKRSEISAFLADPKGRDRLVRARDDALDALLSAQQKANEAQALLAALSEHYDNEANRLAEQLAGLGRQRAETESRRDDAAKRLVDAKRQLQHEDNTLASLSTVWANLQATLGTAFEALHSAARERDWGDPQSARFGSEQASRQAAVADLLRQEGEAAAGVVSAAAADDPVACASLWPVLIRLLRDRLPIGLADDDDEQLLEQAKQIRDDLLEQLKRHEEDLQGEASVLYRSVFVEVRRQMSRIDELNRLGATIEFGNVVGLRFHATAREELLSTLERVSAQLSLLVDETEEPIHLLLERLFRQVYDVKFDGSALMDYRNYMEVRLQVLRRRATKWEPASNLSGGEAIGGGLAATLILARSLHQMGPVPPTQFTPMFIIDEVHRLDREGHKVIVEMCRREGFQMLVTAIELEPAYPCALYTLHREYDPEERVVMRRAQVKAPDDHAGA